MESVENSDRGIRTSTNTTWIWLVVILVIFSGAIYWFMIRPGQTRNECYQYAYGTPNLGNTTEWKQATSYYYEACLHRKGL